MVLLPSDFIRHSLIVPLGASQLRLFNQVILVKLSRRHVPIQFINLVLKHAQREKRQVFPSLAGRFAKAGLGWDGVFKVASTIPCIFSNKMEENQ
jgi:hypothetical protein